MTELERIQHVAEEIGWKCISLYRWSRSECQYMTRYESITGAWEWYFW